MDGRFGADTHAALLHFQRAQLGGGDGRVESRRSHPWTPERRRRRTAEDHGTARAASVATPLELAMDAARLAYGWAADAQAHLDSLLPPARCTGRASDRLITVNTHFHLDRDVAGSLGAIRRLLEVFARMAQVLEAAADVLREGPSLVGSPVVEAPLGALHTADAAVRAIMFRPGFARCGPNTRAALLLHACAHFVGDAGEIGHFALEFPAPDGAPHERGARELP